MYEHHISDFGTFKKHTLIHAVNKHQISIVPEFGACLLDLQFDGQSVIDGYQDAKEMQINKWYKNVVLFPFPNRLNEGRYIWNDTTYQFPINDSYTDNALHGFGAEKPMEVISVNVSTDYASIRCRYTDEGDNPAYPFPFIFEIEFEINNKNECEIELYFKNNHDEAIPAGVGWHPYFKFPEKVNDLQLQFPQCSLVGVDEYMIPTGKKYEYTDFETLTKINTTVLDNCFALPVKEGRATMNVQSQNNKLTYWQETGVRKYNFIQVFTPPNRTAFAIEPMTCNVDAFNNGDGQMVLESGEVFSGKFGFNFE